MSDFTRRLLTIVTEAALETSLTKVFDKLGAQGYTISDARGKGSRGVRNARWEATANIRIEIICDQSTCEKISLHLKEHFYDNYAMILFESDVTVLRPGKF